MWDFSGSLDSKESACNAGDWHSIPGSGRSPGRGNGSPIFLPGKSHEQRSLVGYRPWGCKESDMTEWLSMLSVYPRAQAIWHMDFSSCGHMFRPDNSDTRSAHLKYQGLCVTQARKISVFYFIRHSDWFRERHMTQAGQWNISYDFCWNHWKREVLMVKRLHYWEGESLELLQAILSPQWKWTKPKQSPKETNPKGNCPEYSLEGLMLRLKLQYFGHRIRRADSWERPWCWERLRAREKDDRGWDGWIASSTQWTWVWANSRR